jgi:hypothetical protein
LRLSGPTFCSIHGANPVRSKCGECNANYMRDYQRNRRAANPKAAMLERAKERAGRAGLKFALTTEDIEIPDICPVVLAIPIVVGGSRSGNSPSLDRIVPDDGYTPDNVRVVSSKANGMKGNRSLAELQTMANSGPVKSRNAYGLIAAYVEREDVLRQVRAKALTLARQANEWAKVELFLDRAFRRHPVATATHRHA